MKKADDIRMLYTENDFSVSAKVFILTNRHWAGAESFCSEGIFFEWHRESIQLRMERVNSCFHWGWQARDRIWVWQRAPGSNLWPLFFAISTDMTKNSFVLLSLFASQTFVGTIRVLFTRLNKPSLSVSLQRMCALGSQTILVALQLSVYKDSLSKVKWSPLCICCNNITLKELKPKQIFITCVENLSSEGLPNFQ